MADMDDYSYLESLPFDLQRFLLVNYLGPETTACLRLCSSRMRTICDNDEIWRDFCCRDLHIKPKEIGVPYKFHLPLPPDHGIPPEVPSALISASLTTFYKIYTLLLHTFRGFLKRLLTSSSTAYGDVFTLSYDNGRLVGEAWFLSQIITDAMKAVTDFTIFIDELSDGAVILHEFARTEAEVKEFKRGDFVVDRQSVDPEGGPWVTFKFRSHFSNPRTQAKLISKFKTDNISFPFSQRHLSLLRLDDLLDVVNFEDVLFDVERLKPSFKYLHRIHPALSSSYRIPAWASSLSLPIGLFKGTYGAHGNELVQMKVLEGLDSSLNLVGEKLTGDPNVPAGNITFHFSMAHAIVLSLNQQDDYNALQAMHDVGPFQPIDRAAILMQPFKMPNGMHLRERGAANLMSDTCLCRFVGHGTIAGHGFMDPSSIVTHLVVFSPQRFVVLWFGEFDFVSLFEKVSLDDRMAQYL